MGGQPHLALPSDDLLAGIHHHVAQAVFSLPFAHVSGVQNMPGMNALQHWHAEALGNQIASLTTQINDRLRGFGGKEKDNNVVDSTNAMEKKKNRPGLNFFRRSSANDIVKAAAKTVAPIDTSASSSSGPIVCIEFTRGKRRVYRQKLKSTEDPEPFSSSFSVADDYVTHRRRLRDAAADYLLPQGFPDSVAPQYAKYMGWRGVQYFFGGAMSVFTTRSLLGAVGIANKHSGEAAAAINWVVKDGAGRMGRFLFARWGRELDCELKQFRLGGDILMEAGAALELSTALAPQLFLPLACTANLAKNLAAVAASSTRAPIYKTFALQNNLADVTAKGESVANLADVLGTICGIMLAKANLPVIPTFAILSCGYLLASRREVDSVELPYLNRARLSYATRRFLNVGFVPAPPEANEKEPLLPWSDPNQKRIVLGATVEEACSNPLELKAALDAFGGKNFALTYRQETKKVFVLFRQGANTMSALQGAIYAHCVLHLVNAAEGKKGENPAAVPLRNGGAVGKLRRHAETLHTSHMNNGSHFDVLGGVIPIKKGQLNPGKEAIDYISSNGSEIWSQFETQANAHGWKLPLTMLNPSETRVHPV
ncbi:hypothetical protein Ndes2526B_g00459 [Nannochloris sp. 'desiccata']